jgi:hypothetical protein
MKYQDRLFILTSDLMAIQKEYNTLKADRDALALKVAELQELCGRQQRLLGQVTQNQTDVRLEL